MYANGDLRALNKLTLGFALLIGTTLLSACQAADTGAQAEPAVYFQLSDRGNSRVDAGLMCTTSYGTSTNRLLLPGFYTGDQRLDIFRFRVDESVFVFYEVWSGSWGRYRVEQFDLKGNLVRTAWFSCGTHDIPVTMVRIIMPDDSSPILGVGLYRRVRRVTEEDRALAESFGRTAKKDGDSFITLGMAGGNLAGGAYLTVDYPESEEYRQEHKLNRLVRVHVSTLKFDDDNDPVDTSIVRTTDGIYIETTEPGLDIPFLRLDTDEDGNPLPPYTPKRP